LSAANRVVCCFCPLLQAAFYDPANPVLPNCFLPAAGAQLVCTGYTWMGFGHNDDNGVGSTAFLIPYNNP